MGSQASSGHANKLLLTSVNIDRIDATMKDFSSYKGIKSSSHTSGFYNNTNDQSKTSTSLSNKSKGDLAEIVFIWKGISKEVYVTGTFSNWKQWFILENKGDGSFSRKIILPKEKISFKFIVDGIWCISNDYLTEIDSKGNINNIILPLNDKAISEKLEKDKKKKLKGKPKPVSCDSYNEIIPERSNLNTIAPDIPCDYISNIDLDNIVEMKSNCGNIFKFDCLELKLSKLNFRNKIYSYCNCSSVNISTCSHIYM